MSAIPYIPARGACDRCKYLKLACDNDGKPGSSCARCARARSKCVFSGPKKRGPRKYRQPNEDHVHQADVSEAVVEQSSTATAIIAGPSSILGVQRPTWSSGLARLLRAGVWVLTQMPPMIEQQSSEGIINLLLKPWHAVAAEGLPLAPPKGSTGALVVAPTSGHGGGALIVRDEGKQENGTSARKEVQTMAIPSSFTELFSIDGPSGPARLCLLYGVLGLGTAARGQPREAKDAFHQARALVGQVLAEPSVTGLLALCVLFLSSYIPDAHGEGDGNGSQTADVAGSSNLGQLPMASGPTRARSVIATAQGMLDTLEQLQPVGSVVETPSDARGAGSSEGIGGVAHVHGQPAGQQGVPDMLHMFVTLYKRAHFSSLGQRLVIPLPTCVLARATGTTAGQQGGSAGPASSSPKTVIIFAHLGLHGSSLTPRASLGHVLKWFKVEALYGLGDTHGMEPGGVCPYCVVQGQDGHGSGASSSGAAESARSCLRLSLLRAASLLVQEMVAGFLSHEAGLNLGGLDLIAGLALVVTGLACGLPLESADLSSCEVGLLHWRSVSIPMRSTLADMCAFLLQGVQQGVQDGSWAAQGVPGQLQSVAWAAGACLEGAVKGASVDAGEVPSQAGKRRRPQGSHDAAGASAAKSSRASTGASLAHSSPADGAASEPAHRLPYDPSITCTAPQTEYNRLWHASTARGLQAWTWLLQQGHVGQVMAASSASGASSSGQRSSGSSSPSSGMTLGMGMGMGMGMGAAGADLSTADGITHRASSPEGSGSYNSEWGSSASASLLAHPHVAQPPVQPGPVPGLGHVPRRWSLGSLLEGRDGVGMGTAAMDGLPPGMLFDDGIGPPQGLPSPLHSSLLGAGAHQGMHPPHSQAGGTGLGGHWASGQGRDDGEFQDELDGLLGAYAGNTGSKSVLPPALDDVAVWGHL